MHPQKTLGFLSATGIFLTDYPREKGKKKKQNNTKPDSLTEFMLPSFTFCITKAQTVILNRCFV